jgi:hypothetical protein
MSVQSIVIGRMTPLWMAPILRYLKDDSTLALPAERQRRDGINHERQRRGGITALGATQGNRMQNIMSTNGAAA